MKEEKNNNYDKCVEKLITVNMQFLFFLVYFHKNLVRKVKYVKPNLPLGQKKIRYELNPRPPGDSTKLVAS